MPGPASGVQKGIELQKVPLDGAKNIVGIF